jgi:hypothetical protein
MHTQSLLLLCIHSPLLARAAVHPAGGGAAARGGRQPRRVRGPQHPARPHGRGPGRHRRRPCPSDARTAARAGKGTRGAAVGRRCGRLRVASNRLVALATAAALTGRDWLGE